MAKKLTAVEWLVEQLEQHHTSIDIKNTVVFQQAKAMEKEQQKYFFECGRNFQLTGEGTFEQYYTSTYNS